MSTRFVSIWISIPQAFLTLLGASALLFAGCSQKESPQPPSPTDELIGRWVRPDGGYIMQIRSIADDGKLDVAYLNPSPINVETASAAVSEKGIELLVVLQDTGYPGSTYRLHYEKESDRFTGTYFLPATGQTFDIFFERTK